MKNLDKESQKNLMEVYRFLGYLLMITALSFINLFIFMELIPSWSWGLIVIFCGLIVRVLDKLLSIKQMFVISSLLLVISILLTIFV
ncbi:hypothetical protein BKP45_20955 [Anaerobacillus alkalidiazotrophicus]|uniref:Uncharacterized protein n=1 Tax=Anaerobacillus alkalidiazotrophicus TaxID=472963 RepID=A0A1S2LZE7_9BACI|nr:hypothetical protein BKP45_20955 [Anaerobacillus alkalidiazotrophicus]